MDETLDPLLRRYFAPVLRDLRATTDVRLEFDTDHSALTPREEQVFKDSTLVVIDGEIVTGISQPNWLNEFGRHVVEDGPPWHLVLGAANYVQSLIIENALSSWPPCPAHRQHPMWPVAEPDQPDRAGPRTVVWSCRSEPTVRFKVGTLGTSP